MRKLASIALAGLTAFSAAATSSTTAEARYRGRDGAVAFGLATAVIAGIALSRHHRHHRRYYGYYDGYYDYAPRYRYSYGYYPRSRSYAYGNMGHRGYNPAFPRVGGGHRHHRH